MNKVYLILLLILIIFFFYYFLSSKNKENFTSSYQKINTYNNNNDVKIMSLYHDNTYIALASNSKVTILNTSQIISSTSDNRPYEINFTNESIKSLEFSNTEKFLAIGLSNGIIKIFNTSNLNNTVPIEIISVDITSSITTSPPNKGILSLSFNYNDTLLAVGSENTYIYIYDISNIFNNEIILLSSLNINTDEVTSLEFQTDLLAASSGSETFIYKFNYQNDPLDFSLISTLNNEGNLSKVNAVKFSNNIQSDNLLCVATEEGTIYLYKTINFSTSRSPRPYSTFEQINSPITSIDFNNNDTILVVGSENNNTYIYNLKENTAPEILFDANGYINDLLIIEQDNGTTYLLSGSNDNNIYSYKINISGDTTTSLPNNFNNANNCNFIQTFDKKRSETPSECYSRCLQNSNCNSFQCIERCGMITGINIKGKPIAPKIEVIKKLSNREILLKIFYKNNSNQIDHLDNFVFYILLFKTFNKDEGVTFIKKLYYSEITNTTISNLDPYENYTIIVKGKNNYGFGQVSNEETFVLYEKLINDKKILKPEKDLRKEVQIELESTKYNTCKK